MGLKFASLSFASDFISSVVLSVSIVGQYVGVGSGTFVGVGSGTFVGVGSGTFVGVGSGTFVGVGSGTFVGVGSGTFVGVGVGIVDGVGVGILPDCSGVSSFLMILFAFCNPIWIYAIF